MKVWLGIVIALIGVGVLLMYALTSHSDSKVIVDTKQASTTPITWLGATPAQASQYTISWARRFHQIHSGTPQVLLARPATTEELPSLGLDCIAPAGEYDKIPLVMVILKGDFDFNQLSVIGSSYKAVADSYVLYLVDLKDAGPIYVRGSLHGGLFRKALNDPSLPEDYPRQTKDLPVTPFPCAGATVAPVR
jgi:hypothetical protein